MTSTKYINLLHVGEFTRRRLLVLLVTIISITVGPVALAEHEENHRYTVAGYVLNEDESPIKSTTVTIGANGTGTRGKTDSDGYFSLRLHLHDSDLGRTLRIKTEYGKGTVRVSFDPTDLDTPRVHHVNIIGDRLIEGQVGNSGRVPNWVFYLFGLTILIIAITFLGQPLKHFSKRLHASKKELEKKSKSRTRSKPQKKRKRRK